MATEIKGPKTARKSGGRESYACKYPWPADCFVQCGDRGIVLDGKQKAYYTAFFEAFPNDPDTFIRGDGETIEEAEKAAWEKYERVSGCDHPEFEKRGYTNGAGFCVKCGMFDSKHYAPWDNCPHCDYPVYPEQTCWHCEMFVETGENDNDFIRRFLRESREAARWLVEQNRYHCPICSTEIKDMRLVSSSDYGITREMGRKQEEIYFKTYGEAAVGKPLYPPPDKKITFPASIFYKCKCDDLKLITDLVGE